MKYIIIIDNDKKNREILQSLLIDAKKKRNLSGEYTIGAWQGLVEQDFEKNYQLINDALRGLFMQRQEAVHFIIDLLLTNDEERNITNYAEQLAQPNGNSCVATGIKLANHILRSFPDADISVTFMSKWIDLQDEGTARRLNGIRGNSLWDNRVITSVTSPVNENHLIVNRDLVVPKYFGKTVVDSIINVAFDIGTGENADE